ncbi:MAG: hypothetical protein H0W97_11645 [Actinobacteria bacterium]|nr:hypothetical protein [Actinomycetota bacterium]
MTDDQRVRTAHHEAGHAAMAWVLGRSVGVVSIRPSEHVLGLAFWGPARRATVPAGVSTRPAVLWPADLRRSIETSILISLAGEIAERYAPPQDAPRVTRLPERVAPLTPRETSRLADVEAAEIHQTDWQRAVELIDLLADPDGGSFGHAYLEALAALADEIVRSPRFRALADALIPVLLGGEVVSARTVREIFRASDPEYRERPQPVAARSKGER